MNLSAPIGHVFLKAGVVTVKMTAEITATNLTAVGTLTILHFCISCLNFSGVWYDQHWTATSVQRSLIREYLLSLKRFLQNEASVARWWHINRENIYVTTPMFFFLCMHMFISFGFSFII